MQRKSTLVDGNGSKLPPRVVARRAAPNKESRELTCFISSAFTSRLDEIGKVLVKQVSKQVEEHTTKSDWYRHSYSISWKRLDEAPFLRPTIGDNVFSSMKACHFAIADVTPQFAEIPKKGELGEKLEKREKVVERQAPNPSVMHEIGFANGLGMVVFLIGHKGTNDHLPANLKGSLVSEYADSDLDPDKPSKFAKSLADTIIKYIDDHGPPLPPGEFRVEGYRQRRKVDLPYLLSNAKYRIYILTTNLDYIVTRLKDPIEFALKHNLKGDEKSRNQTFKVDILTMDPESIVTNARAKQINQDVAVYRDSLRKHLLAMKKFQGTYPRENMEIATYVSLPTLIMFVIDDAVVWSVPFPSQQSRMVPHFMVEKDDVATQQFVSYFFSVKSQAAVQALM